MPISALCKLIENRKEFGSVEALCIDLCGGVDVAGHMLKRLLYWWQKTSRKDGWVYKSHVDWYNELRISQKQLSKANKALAFAGVETALIKGRLPSAIKHYRLNVDKFVSALAKVTGLDEAFIKNFCANFANSTSSKGTTGDSQKGKLDFTKTAHSTANDTADSSSPYKQEKTSTSAARDGDDVFNPDSGEENLPKENKTPRFEETKHEADAPALSPNSAAPLPRYVEKLVSLHALNPITADAYIAKHGADYCDRVAEIALGGDKPAGLWRALLDKGDYKNVKPRRSKLDDFVIR
jgi:hypothetical protein